MIRLTKTGRRKVENFIKELEAKRKEILDAGKDAADETTIPTIEDIEADINWDITESDGEYCNGWAVTDNYDSDHPLTLSKTDGDFTW